MNKAWRSLIKAVVLLILTISNINCSQQDEIKFTYKRTLIFNSVQVNLPVEFTKEQDNQWSYESGIKKARFLISISSSKHPDFDKPNQIVLNIDARDYKYINSDSIFSADKIVRIYTYSKKVLLKRDPPISGLSYHSVAEIIFEAFQIRLESESDGFNMEPTIMRIANSIQIVHEKTEYENDDKNENEQYSSTPVNENSENKFSGKDISDIEVMKEYLITENSVGFLGKRGVMPALDSFDDYAIRIEVRKFTLCDDFDETVLVFSREGIDEFYAVRDEEFWKKNNQARVNDFYILSDKFKTKEKIGVGSTIEDFIKAYPDYELIGNCGRLLAKRKDSWVFFYFDRNDYVGNKEISRPVVKLELREIKPEAQIVEIKI